VKSKNIFLVLICATLLLATATASTKLFHPKQAQVLTGSSSVGASVATQSAAAQGSDSQDSTNIQVVLVALRPEGFEPAEIELPAGEYLFVVRNRTGLDEINVRLQRENGEPLGQGKIEPRRKDWKQRLKLTPGTYILSEDSHSDWHCRIVVGK
jgi:hypothetical protein